MATLHRCPAPTNWLCACGRVERELRRAGIAHETVREPLRRRDRDAIHALTGQRVVPVLALDGEAIVDSRRIVEHLRRRAAAKPPAGAG